MDGVYTADPRIVKNARKLESISYDEMLELASLGAKVLHNRSVEMAKKYGVQLIVRSSLNRSEGTVVKEVAKMEKMLISGVASDKNTSRVSVIGVQDKPGVAFKIFNTLAKKGINVDIILQSVGRGGTKDISFTVSQEDLNDTLKTLEENKESLTIQEIKHKDNVAKISIVGAGMMSNPGVAAKMFESLFNAQVNISMISTSEVRITVLIDENDVERAMVAVHDGFGLGA
ncbi:aspartokinase [Lachnospiraceae bacterium CAG:215]|nr:aspartokinase [Lachnospiraceae bacterium CAG:215]